MGRAEELKEIGRHLARGVVRLLTLVGPGGTGKTRPALQAAADHADRFEDGVFFVDLSPVREIESVLTVIADSVGLKEPAGQLCSQSSRGTCTRSSSWSSSTTSSRSFPRRPRSLGCSRAAPASTSS